MTMLVLCDAFCINVLAYTTYARLNSRNSLLCSTHLLPTQICGITRLTNRPRRVSRIVIGHCDRIHDEDDWRKKPRYHR
ncbi:hypothetical protein EV401DRAFT_1971373 [Pisolithus croceorrhizus]|nr:hypothetical protein EV401DRAFT_1971373 [Pisolithus croceorrhizus]